MANVKALSLSTSLSRHCKAPSNWVGLTAALFNYPSDLPNRYYGLLFLEMVESSKRTLKRVVRYGESGLVYEKLTDHGQEEDINMEDTSNPDVSQRSYWEIMDREARNRPGTTSVKVLLIVAVICSLLASFATWATVRLSLQSCGSETEVASESASPTTMQVFDENHLEGEHILECGKTREEAVARGCMLDILAAAWLPEACYDAEFAMEAISPNTTLAELGGAGPNDWFLDENHTKPIAQESLQLRDERFFYTDQAFHISHCIYMWRVENRAMSRVRKGESPVYVSTEALGQDHTRHCGMMFAQYRESRNSNEKITFKMGKCIRIDEMPLK